MPILFGVDHDVPKKSCCKDCARNVHVSFLEECAIQGKFLFFMGACRSCGAIKWNFAGEGIYVQKFLEMMETTEFEQNFFRKKKINLVNFLLIFFVMYTFVYACICLW